MFPTIFALGIFGLGQRAKKASSFLVMAIMGGAILPKVMGAIADMSDLSRGIYRADGVLCVHCGLCVFVAETQRFRGHARGVGYRRALTLRLDRR